jgi:hypothetical protein
MAGRFEAWLSDFAFPYQRAERLGEGRPALLFA